jgi:hypothetical protein
MLLLSRDFSMSGDEVAQMQLGHNVFDFLTQWPHRLPGSAIGNNYGALFGFISTALARLLPFLDEILLRHLLIALTGFITIIYAGRIARLLYGQRAELICIWALACSPRFFGSSMNNSKDIPFTLGMTIATYFLLSIIKSAPLIRRSHYTGLFVGLFIALGIRIGGVLFGLFAAIGLAWLAYKYWTINRRYVISVAVRMGIVAIASFLAAIIFLPYIWANVLTGAARALSSFTHYYIDLTMLFNGKDYYTKFPPLSYLPVWIAITIPVMVLILFLLSPYLLIRKDRFPTFLLLCIVLLPWLSIIIAGSPVYDGWRQLYFIYPPMVVLASGSGDEIFRHLRTRAMRRVFAGVLAIGLFTPVIWCIRNHPLQNVYFNELIGGVDGAYGRFETDYYGESVEAAFRKLVKQPALKKPLRDSIYIVDNVPTQIIYYLKRYDSMISVRHVDYAKRDSYPWNYGIFYTRGLDSLRMRKDWPPPHMIDSVVADHTLLMAIIRRDNDTLHLSQ